MKKASIVVVGSEILKGLIQDTNSHWLARKLTELGFEVTRIVAVPDRYDDIEWALKAALDASDVVVVTGGLGFTEDDITLAAAARALGLRLVLSDRALEMIKKRVGGELTYQVKAAYIPEGSEPLYNEVGVSPGVHLVFKDKHLFFLPGVPREMTAMFEKYVAPLLVLLAGATYVKQVEVETLHEREAEVDELIRPLRAKYRSVYFKTHATTPVRVSLVIVAGTPGELEELARRVLTELQAVLRVKQVLAG